MKASRHPTVCHVIGTLVLEHWCIGCGIIDRAVVFGTISNSIHSTFV